MARIIDGRALAEKIKDNIVKKIVNLKNNRPNLSIILVGDRSDSKLYVNLKEQEAKKVGIDTHLYKCPKNISEPEILEIINCLNNDKLIDAILIQLPLPDGFNTDKIIATINPAKDVDRFHPENLNTLLKTCDYHHVMPPVFGAILEILRAINCQLKDKQACLISNSKIFGKSLERVLSCQGAGLTIAKADDHNLPRKTKLADILISAVGRPGFIKKNMIKKDAVIIDIGITKNGRKIQGDVDFADVKEKAGYITPVPGGVGPLTIAILFKNTLQLYLNRHKSS